MAKQYKLNGDRNCWGTAREKERLKARYDIRQRVFKQVGEAPFTPNGSPKQAPNDEQREEDKEKVKIFLRHVEAGAVSAFSLSTLSKHFVLLDKPFSTNLLSEYKINSLCASRFGKDCADQMQKFFKARKTCTIMEYASLLGEYKILGSLIMGGVDPTQRGQDVSLTSLCPLYDERMKEISVRVMRRFFENFPLSLKAYIIKRVVDMRVEASLELHAPEGCALCHTNHQLMLRFGTPCRHSYCEPCFWNNMLENVDNRAQGDVVLCPSCGQSSGSVVGVSQNHTKYAMLGGTPLERNQKSLALFEKLPANTRELKSRPKKKNYRKDVLSVTWHDAVARSLGSSRDVRRDKFFNFVEHNAYYFVRGCLEEGMDTNVVNEYSQTGLYLASWKGYKSIVHLLLDYGADVSIMANGGSNAIDAASWNRHHEIASMLLGLSFPFGERDTGLTCLKSSTAVNLSRPVAKMLIDPEKEHPGAGSCIIDDTLSASEIGRLIRMWQVIPADVSDKKSMGKCSNRHYFCDVAGRIQKNLSNAIYQAGVSKEALVFPHMRFLHYAYPGTSLAPHVDLCRVDSETGKRSTHTFILYLQDCESGGETALLDDLSGTSTLALVEPRKGRLLLFPHSCPHEGKQVVTVPKILLRGEVCLANC